MNLFSVFASVEETQKRNKHHCFGINTVTISLWLYIHDEYISRFDITDAAVLREIDLGCNINHLSPKEAKFHATHKGDRSDSKRTEHYQSASLWA